MDDLNAQQIVLLTLLVSFVTSIATGITTVSLLERAPDPITQTINRVVEKTVERVVEVQGEDNTKIERVVETVVVNAEDLTIDAVSKNSDSIVRVYNKIGQQKLFVGIGIIISRTGEIVMDSRNIFKGEDYIGVFPSGEKELEISFRQSNNPFATLTIVGDNSESFAPAIFGDSQSIRLGQSVIMISGSDHDFVSTGIITSLDQQEIPADPNNPESTAGTVVKAVDTSVNGIDVVSGSVLLNLKGEIIAAKINGDPNNSSEFLPVNTIKNFIASQVVAVETE